MNDIKLALFYNSLWYYYNCEASYDRDFGDYYNNNKYGYSYDKNVKHCWQPLPGCGGTWPKLPYTPQGYIYSFKSWLEDNWTPWINSDSTIPPSEISAAYPGITLWTWFQGPAPIFMPQRVIVRYTYDPSGPFQKNWKNGYGQDFSYNIPSLTPGLTGDWKSYWNYPKNWWKGTPDKQYIEVTYSDILEIGSGALVWWNGMPGSGVWLDVGKCKRARNKADGAFQLAKEMGETADGRAKLKEWFYSSDPYDILAGLLQNKCVQKGVQLYDPTTDGKITVNYCGSGSSFYALPTGASGWNTVPQFGNSDWYAWCGKEKGDDSRANYAYNLPNICIDKLIKGSNYQADRITSQGPFDEAMSCIGWWLGYDTIQLTQSANGSGFWQIEMLELRNFPVEAKNRDYSKFLQWNKDDKTVNWRFDNGWIKQYMDKTMQYLSVRDPLDPLNGKSLKCQYPVMWQDQNDLGWTWNSVCKNTASEMFTKLSLNNLLTHDDGNPAWDQCSPDGIGFNGERMVNKNSQPFG
jgi:hypothetical protein